MPDITMCSSLTCPSRQQCYRHEAKPNPYGQSYCDFDAIRGEAKKCDRFMQVKQEVDAA